MICSVNQLTGFYMMATLAFNELIKNCFSNPPETDLSFHLSMKMLLFNQKPYFDPVNPT